MPKLTALSHLGLAKETTYGTPVTATSFLPMKNPNIRDEIAYIPDEGMRGHPSQVFDAYQGMITSEVEWEGDWYPQDTDHLIMGMLGVDGVSGGSDPWTHALTLASSQPPSYTLVDSAAGTQARQYPGCVVHTLTMKFTPQEGLTYSAHAMGLKSSTVAIPTQSFEASPFFLGWQAAVTIGGGAVARLTGFELTIDRPVEAVLGAANSQTPNRIFAGPIDVSGRMSFWWDDDTELTHYLNNDEPAIVVTFDRGVTPARQLILQMTKTGWQHGALNRGKSYVEIDADIRALANATDGSASILSPLKVTGKNARSTAY